MAGGLIGRRPGLVEALGTAGESTQDLAKPGVGAPACAVGAVHGGDSGMMISLAVGLGAVEDTAGEIEVPTETGQEVAVGAAIPLTELAASG